MPKRKVPLGKAIRWTDAELDTLTQFDATSPDVERAAVHFRAAVRRVQVVVGQTRYVMPKANTLLDVQRREDRRLN